MKLSSPQFGNGDLIPVQYTGDGKNINPPLSISEIPTNTKSLVLIVEDQDASPTAWTHWLLYNIPPSVSQLPEGSIPSGASEGLANGGTPGYEGPNQQYFTGSHHYAFTLYALDTLLEGLSLTRSQVESLMSGHVLAEATLIGLQYGHMK